MIRARTAPGLALALALGIAIWIAPSPGAALATFVNELPRAKPVVSFHPRSDAPFALDHLRRALRAGVHGAELDLRWRATDSTVVCSHDARDLEARPSLGAALDVILGFQGPSRSVQGDGLQFYVTLDLKEDGDAYYRAIVATLRDRAKHWSTSARLGEEPRGITVVANGSRAAFERADPLLPIYPLCLIEREDATLRGQILDLSDRDGPLAWVALEHPTTRERIQAIHQGRDAQFGGRFNVRVYGAGRHIAKAIAMGADAVNADLDQIGAAVARTKVAGGATRAGTTAAAAAAAAKQAEQPFWTFQGWKVDPANRAAFEAAWRKRASARHARAGGWRGGLLLRSQADPSVYETIERWDNDDGWKRYVLGAGARSDTSLLDALRALGTPYSTQKMLEVEDRFGAGPVAGNYFRFYHITTRPGTARAFRRAFLRANDAIRASHPAALGASLVREPNREDRPLEIVRWESEAAWRRFADSRPADLDADAVIRAARSDVVTRTYVGVDIVP